MAASPSKELAALRRLALLRGVQTSYLDILHGRRTPPPETLLAVLRCLGEPLETMRDVPEAFRRAEESAWDRLCPPVCVAWEHGPAEVELRVPREFGNDRVRIGIELESGERQEADCSLSRVPVSGEGNGSRGECVAKRIPLPWKTPYGYHRLDVELRGVRGEATVLSAPARAWSPPGGKRRDWGVFLPLYALHSRRSPGGGDLTGLRELMDWVRDDGRRFRGVPPAALGQLSPADRPQPLFPLQPPGLERVLPRSRARPRVRRMRGGAEDPLLRRVPGGGGAPPALPPGRLPRQDGDAAPRLRSARGALLPRRVRHRARRSAGSFPRTLPWRTTPRSARRGTRRGTPWPAWPSPLKDGLLRRGDFGESAKRYHLFVQYALHLQLRDLSSDSRKLLYLDLPLGTSYDGYDVWRRRSLFALEASAGAPPDDFFTKGQDWGFPPPHPERWREEGHAYFRECLANQLRYAGTLRIDHVMGLHRFFWVPKGASPMDGTYVRYPAEELYAVLCLESNRNRTRLVGEDLGTVPPYVRPAMARHGIRGSTSRSSGCRRSRGRPLGGIPKASVACLNTHDMPTFASFWNGLDVEDRVSLGFLDRAAAVGEKSAAGERPGRPSARSFGEGEGFRGGRGSRRKGRRCGRRSPTWRRAPPRR